jgi:hypothetical protein
VEPQPVNVSSEYVVAGHVVNTPDVEVGDGDVVIGPDAVPLVRVRVVMVADSSHT